MDRDLQMLQQIDNPCKPWTLPIEATDRQRLKRRGWLWRWKHPITGLHHWDITEAGRRALEGDDR